MSVVVMSLELKRNKIIVSKNLDILEDNIQALSDKLGSEASYNLTTDIYVISSKLKDVKTDCGLRKVFFDFFMVMQAVHLFVEENYFSDLVRQKYSGYLNLDSDVAVMRKETLADNVHVLIKNTRIFMRRIKYLDGYLGRNFMLERISEMTGSNNGLDRYGRRLGRILNSLIKMLNSDEKSVKKIASMSDKLHEIRLLINDLEGEIKRLPDFREKLRPAEQLIEDKF